MKETYTLHPIAMTKGRTLWGNLVTGEGTSKLDAYPGFTQTARTKETYTAIYKDQTTITITHPNNITLESNAAEDIYEAKNQLVQICNEKTTPIILQK